ncbi:MAG: PEP-utilizing enzyme [bacterium]
MGYEQIIDHLNRNSSKQTALLIRHSERCEPGKDNNYYNIPLTQNGRKMAKDFGKSLPIDRNFRIYYSPPPRCKETAEQIKDGLLSSGGSVSETSQQDFLGTNFINSHQKMVSLIEKIGISAFSRKWISRNIEPEIISDPFMVISQIFNGLINAFENKGHTGNEIDIHITHDWNLLAVRDIFLDLKHEVLGRPDYLDGLLFSYNNEKISLKYKNIKKEFYYGISDKLELKGLPASHGIEKGVVRVIHSLDDLSGMEDGEILVASETNPQYLSALFKSRAIITDRGGILSHAAIVARETGIPGVVATGQATKILKTGDLVAIDGDNGFIYQKGGLNETECRLFRKDYDGI